MKADALNGVTTTDIVDALIFVKFKDGRIRQVIMSQQEAVTIARAAALIRPQFQVLDEDQGVNFYRQEEC